jgi:hypothetical protein
MSRNRGYNVTMPEIPHIDRVPAHQQQAFLRSDGDADIDCTADCVACEIIYAVDRWYDAEDVPA